MSRKSRQRQRRKRQKVRSQQLAAERASAARRAAASQAADERRQARLRAAEEGRARGCMWCRRSDGGFTSEEHIVPESLGNSEHILPVGVVCDRCNNQVLSKLDAALLGFPPVQMMRAMYGIPSKRGKLPTFKFHNGSLSSKAPGEIMIELASRKWHRDDLPAAPGRRAFSFAAKSNAPTPKQLELVQRALVKIAIEYAWLDLGPEAVLSERFDREREIVLKGGHHGYLVLPKNGDPEQRSVSLTYDTGHVRKTDGHPLTFIVASIYGVYLLTDTLFEEPQSPERPDWLQVHTF